MVEGQRYDDSIRVRITSDRREKLEEIAHRQSEPGRKVTVSDLAREAIGEFLRQREDDESAVASAHK